MEIFFDESKTDELERLVEKMWLSADELGMVEPVIKRCMKDIGDSREDVILGLNSFFRLMALSFVYPGKIAYTKFPDDRGHVFAFNTERYSKFCDMVFGRFVHHTPDEYCDRALLDSLERGTIEAYRFHFPETVSL